jgi:hypothetical protein
MLSRPTQDLAPGGQAVQGRESMPPRRSTSPFAGSYSRYSPRTSTRSTYQPESRP